MQHYIYCPGYFTPYITCYITRYIPRLYTVQINSGPGSLYRAPRSGAGNSGPECRQLCNKANC